MAEPEEIHSSADSVSDPLLRSGVRGDSVVDNIIEVESRGINCQNNGIEDEEINKRLSIYTQDGSVDVRGQPSVKAETGSWKACPFILGNECCERLAYYGIATNLVTYLTSVLHENNAAAATSVSSWSGTCYITPLVGAFLADAYIGRYWTIAIFSSIYFVGMMLLTLSASIPAFKPACAGLNGTCSATVTQLAAFYIPLYLIAIGTGGIKPCVSSFGADQFDDNDPKEFKKKGSFFNWFYFSVNIGALVSSSILVYIQENYSWGLGFGIPAAAMGIAICSFFFGSSLYRNQKPGGSPLTRIMQVCVVACRKRQIPVPSDSTLLFEPDESVIQGSRKLEHTNTFRCLDKAAVMDKETDIALITSSGLPDGWKVCTVTQVEEVKALIRLVPVWAATIFFSTIYSQMSTFFVEQGKVMDTSIGPHFQIPSACLSIFDTLSVIICVPLYDGFLVPLVRRYTGNPRGFTQLQRMGIGLIISVVTMIMAALVEIKRLDLASTGILIDGTAAPMSIFWQIPQYFLVGASEVFTFIGQLEFFYDQAPDAMRSLCSALSLLSTSLGSYVSALLVAIITRITTKGGSSGWIPDDLNKGHLDYFFWLLAILSALNFLFYLVCACMYTHKKTIQLAHQEN